MRLPTRTTVVAAVLLAGTLGTGCLGDDEGTKAGGTKAGGTQGPVTLRMGTDDFPGKPASRQIEEFARRVEALSGGEIRIEPVWHAAGDGPDWDQRVARMVTSGELDMGMIPSRSWDTEAVTSLRALNAPFLVDSDELVAEVVSSDELARELLSGLDEADVVGLALVPEGLRHPFGLEKPLLGPDDYAGKTIRAPTSGTVAAVFEALGASVNDEEPDEKLHAGVESSYPQKPVGTATGDVAFFPKVNSLVINEDAFDRLDEEQRNTLRQAATETRDWAITKNPSDPELAQAFCDGGSAVALAGEANVAALERATRPVYDELERDKQTRQLIASIRRMKQDVPVSATPAKACGQAGDGPGPTEREVSSELDGVYRYEVTDEHLRRAGMTDPGRIADNHGVMTQTLEAGESCWTQRAPNPTANAEGCERYEIDGDVVTFIFPAGEPDVLRWKKLPNGDLKLTFVSAQPGEEEVVRALVMPVWKRIGDPE